MYIYVAHQNRERGHHHHPRQWRDVFVHTFYKKQCSKWDLGVWVGRGSPGAKTPIPCLIVRGSGDDQAERGWERRCSPKTPKTARNREHLTSSFIFHQWLFGYWLSWWDKDTCCFNLTLWRLFLGQTWSKLKVVLILFLQRKRLTVIDARFQDIFTYCKNIGGKSCVYLCPSIFLITYMFRI